MLPLLFIALYQVVGGAPATPPPAPTTEQTAEEAAPADRLAERNHRRCRVQAVTGSRLGSRVCLSQAEEELLEREAQGLIQDSMRMWDNQSSPGGTLVCDRPAC